MSRSPRSIFLQLYISEKRSSRRFYAVVHFAVSYTVILQGELEVGEGDCIAYAYTGQHLCCTVRRFDGVRWGEGWYSKGDQGFDTVPSRDG